MPNSKVRKEEIPKSVKVIKSIFKIIFIIGILGIPVYFLWSWASQSDTFIVKQIEVRGNTYFPDKAIIDSLQIGIGSRIFGVNLEKPRHKLEKNLFFDEVAILRSLPST
ncbi:FtsQ-type POTRA domain-containing protein, partial [bacterium]|nr:FtsQ-type POTRA domain-containing protein [bacterium]